MTDKSDNPPFIPQDTATRAFLRQVAEVQDESVGAAHLECDEIAENHDLWARTMNLAVETINALEGRVSELEEQLDEIEDRTAVIESDCQSGKYARFRDIVEFAYHRGSTKSEVGLTYDDVAGAARCTDKHAYTLMEQMDEEYPHAYLVDPSAPGGADQSGKSRVSEKTLYVQFNDAPVEQQIDQLQRLSAEG